jgi:hypothetical protein
LNVASTPRDFRKKDDWSTKPLYEPKSTTPVAHHKVTKRELAKMSNVVISPDYTLTWAVALLGPLIMWYHPCKSLKHLSAWSLASVHDLVLHLWWCRVVSDFWPPIVFPPLPFPIMMSQNHVSLSLSPFHDICSIHGWR